MYLRENVKFEISVRFYTEKLYEGCKAYPNSMLKNQHKILLNEWHDVHWTIFIRRFQIK